jgi:FtsH-binding integral membrane protein
MEFLKKSAGMILAGLVALGVLVGAISWWSAEPATRQIWIGGAGHLLGWFAVVLFLPWATFFIVAAVERRDNNTAGAMLVGAYTLCETASLMWLLHIRLDGAGAFTGLAAAALFAGVYNVFACDWIAEKV